MPIADNLWSAHRVTCSEQVQYGGGSGDVNKDDGDRACPVCGISCGPGRLKGHLREHDEHSECSKCKIA